MREDLKKLLDETVPEDVTLTEVKKNQILRAAQERNNMRKSKHKPKFIPALITVALIGISGLWAYPYVTQEDLPQEIQGGDENQLPAEENPEMPVVEDEDSEEKLESPQEEDEDSEEKPESPQVEDENSEEESESPSVEKEISEEKQEETTEDKPEDSVTEKTIEENKIDMPFQVGEHLSKLIVEYGEPRIDDYLMGGRLVFFEGNNGYFLSESETITGYMIYSPDNSIYGTHIGMTSSEITSVLSNPAGSFYDESETQTYVNVYQVGDYRINFHSETEKGPTIFAIIIDLNQLMTN